MRAKLQMTNNTKGEKLNTSQTQTLNNFITFFWLFYISTYEFFGFYKTMYFVKQNISNTNTKD